MQLFKKTINFLAALKFIPWTKLLVFVLICLCAHDTIAQVVVLKGQVKNEEMPLQGATVSIATATFITDANGLFSVDINPGTFKLKVTHAGFNNIELDIIVTSGENPPLLITMISSGILGEVVILGSRSTLPRSNLYTAVPVDNITSKDLRNTGQPSLIQMLQFSIPNPSLLILYLLHPLSL